MKALLLPLALSMLAGSLDAAQLYRWVDEKGNVEWRDTPPPSGAKKVEQRKVGGSTVQTSELPYSLQQAVKNHPVTLWMTECGEVCDRAREHLNRRGVPHTERNARAEIEAFKKVSGGAMEVPLLLVGSRPVKGYLESEWDAALDAASYPRTAMTGVKSPAKPAAKDAAVLLYTSTKCGERCDEARKLLESRGVKFQEVNADELTGPEDAKRAQAIKGNVPVLMIGKVVVAGFDAASYHKALDASGYQRAAR